jgi:hypothetical protein
MDLQLPFRANVPNGGDQVKPLATGDPRRVGPFELEARLGAGGMGRVYLGRSAGGRRVAVKVVHSHLLEHDPSFRSRFRREVEAAQRVGGFYTAAVVDYDAGADQPWYASAYIKAPTLDDLVSTRKTLKPAAANALGAGLAEALGAIHATGLVHRDLKPSNVLMAEDGIRVIDFGIVGDSAAPKLTGTGLLLGTVGYLSPEQMLGEPATTASDVFALGALLVYATSRHLPFAGSTWAAVARRIERDPPDLSGVPKSLRPILTRCLDPDPSSRPGIADLLAHFGRIHDGAPARSGGERQSSTTVVAAPASAVSEVPETMVEPASVAAPAALTSTPTLPWGGPIRVALLAAMVIAAQLVWLRRTPWTLKDAVRKIPPLADNAVRTWVPGAPQLITVSIVVAAFTYALVLSRSLQRAHHVDGGGTEDNVYMFVLVLLIGVVFVPTTWAWRTADAAGLSWWLSLLITAGCLLANVMVIGAATGAASVTIGSRMGTGDADDVIFPLSGTAQALSTPLPFGFTGLGMSTWLAVVLAALSMLVLAPLLAGLLRGSLGPPEPAGQRT